MSLPPDYHIHTKLCRHAVGELKEYVARAISIGLTEIGFSDHNPMADDGFDDWRMAIGELDHYVELVRKAQKDFQGIDILLGLEVDFIPGKEDWVSDLAHRYDWDYLIGSVHYVEPGWDIDNPAKKDTWTQRDVGSVWSHYFDLLTRAAQSKLFDIIGHVDLCKKFGFIPDRDVSREIDRFLKAAANAGVAIEINTAGLRKDCKEIYPAPRILAAARARNIPITFGSDAHAPAEVGADFASAVSLAKSCGYTHLLKFRQRRRTSVPL